MSKIGRQLPRGESIQVLFKSLLQTCPTPISSALCLNLLVLQNRDLSFEKGLLLTRALLITSTWPSERSLSSCKQLPCLFACSTSLPAPFRAVFTWYSHERDPPNNASCCCRSELRTINTHSGCVLTPPREHWNEPNGILFAA